MDAKQNEETIDLPGDGDRNADPITNEPGAHPLGVGIGAALAGAATGVVAGPVGAAVGAAVGAVAGGSAGKSVGEYIDPTTDDILYAAKS